MNKVSGEIWIVAGEGKDARKNVTTREMRSSSDVHGDLHIMDKAVEFKYAAVRQKKALLVDMIPRWKVPLLKLLGCRFDNGPAS